MTEVAQNEWAGRVAVVTGAGGAMGQALTRELLGRGVEVIALDRPEGLEAADLGAAVPVPVDVGDRDSIRAAFAEVDARGGRLDHLVNFAAMNSQPHSVLDVDEQEWDRVMAVNLAGTFWACQEAVARMKPHGRGSIVNISSLNGFMGRVQFPTHVYAISKAGVIGLTTTLASELGDLGIRVNCVAPGLHVSPMSAAVAGGEDATETFFANAKASTPLRRVADASEMTGPVLFFLSDASGYMTGQLVASDGGRSTWYQ